MKRGAIRTRCVDMTGPDTQMDTLGDSYYDPANPLPIKCPHCTFPDLDFVPKPYLLAKGISSPAETSSAQMGNFLVRERVKRILEVVAPGACSFHPTADRRTKKPAPWWVVVPKHTLEIPVSKPKPPFCPKCREPKMWHCAMGPVWEKMGDYDTGGLDVCKSRSWYSMGTAEDDREEVNRARKQFGDAEAPWSDWGVEAPSHPERWTRQGLQRELFFSVRLEQLFKRAKVKGQLIRSYYFKNVQTTADDDAWIADKLNLLAEHRLAESPKETGGKDATATAKWFRGFVKRNARKGIKRVDFNAVEKKNKVSLPQAYKDFISSVGPKSFEDIIETEGFTAHVLHPAKLDLRNYRRGKVPHLEGEQAQIDGVMFASTDHGDAFVFDVSAKSKDHPVYWHDHEQNTLEPFAPNFAACIKRFAERN